MKRNTDTAAAAAHLAPPDDLRWLIRSVELGSMSAAARERNVTVSQATRAIDRLESGYGVRLLRRSTHGLSLTAEGSAVVAHGREVLARLDDLAQLVAGAQQRVAGTVRMAVSAAIADALLVPRLAELQARHPELRVELVADDRIADLPTEGIDVALRTAIGPSENVVARRLGSFQRGLFASPDYLRVHGEPASLDDLQRHVTVVHTGQGAVGRWRFRVQGKRVDVPVGGGPAANSTWLVQRMLQAGLGIGLVSMPLAAPMVERGELVEVLPRFRDPTRLTMHAVTLPGRGNGARIQAVVDFLAEAARLHWRLD